MKIGELAKATGISPETIRYYEKVHLLPEPVRGSNGYRSYQQAHLDRLLFVKRCRSLDMAQDEIRELARFAEQPEANCNQVDALLARHLCHVRERLKELASLEDTLVQLQQACSDNRTVRECGILGGLNAQIDLPGSGVHRNHVPGSHGNR